MFNLESVLTTESSFKRKVSIDFSKTLQNLADITVENSVSSENLVVSVKVTIKGEFEDKSEQYSISTTTVGVFLKKDETEQSIEDFLRYNAPAIIFPFTREMIASLSLKGGLQPILLPPLNFTRLEDQVEKVEIQVNKKNVNKKAAK